MDSDTAAVMLYLVGGSGFFSALLSLIALLTILRQVRSLQVYRAQRALALSHTRPVPVAPPAPYVPQFRQTREIPRVRLAPNTLPPQWQIPIREGKPDQVVIMIQPDAEPTRHEKNITRLINHLKKLKPAAS